MKEITPKGIENQGRQWADKRRERFASENLDVMIISKEKEYFFDLPVVGNYRQEEADFPLWTPRTHPVTGAIVLSRWEDFKGKQIDFGKDVVFGGQKKDEVLRSLRLPSSWHIRRLVPVVIPDGIEAAMRQQDEIAHDYSDKGVESERVEDVFNLINDLSKSFTDKSIKTQSDVDLISKRAEKMLKDHGLLSSKSDVWANVSRKIKKAADRDSIQRINPMISRIRLRSAFLELIKNEIKTPGVENKARNIYNWLEDERAFVRCQIENATIAMEELIGLNHFRGVDIFENPDNPHTTQDYWEVGQLLKALSQEVLGKVQVAPYLSSVTLARKLLTGAYFENAKEERLLNERLEYIKVPNLRSSECAEGFLRKRKTTEAWQSIKNAHGILKALLHDPDYKITTTF